MLGPFVIPVGCKYCSAYIRRTDPLLNKNQHSAYDFVCKACDIRISTQEKTKKSEEQKQIEEDERKGNAHCIECSKVDIETDIQTCHCLLFKHKSTADSPLRSIALCSTCAIRNHVKKGHEIIDFYPFLREEKLRQFVESLKEPRGKLIQDKNKLKGKMEFVMETLENHVKEIDNMTDMLSRSKTSMDQKICFDKTGEEIANFTQSMETLYEFIENYLIEMKIKLTNLTAENEDFELHACDRKTEPVVEEPTNTRINDVLPF